jgi:cysteine desulfurase
LPNTLHVRFPGVAGNAILTLVPEIAASTGSACHAGSNKPPSAILAIGASKEDALGSVRLSLGRGTGLESTDRAIDLLSRGWRAARGGNPNDPGR